jgi:hypothetical protein
MKKTFFEWLSIIKHKVVYEHFETRIDWKAKTLHLKWKGK